MNPFDQLAIEQQMDREEAEKYRFFINSGFINDPEEVKKLYSWFDRDGSIRDPQGKVRVKLLKKISDVDLINLVDMKKMHYQPSRLSAELLRRIVPKL